MNEDKSIFQKIGDAVADFAPGIATILTATGVGAPVAAAVGAVGALGRAFGLGSNAKPEEVLQAISADPETRLKAQIADNDFKAEMGRQEIARLNVALDETKAMLADVQSAREREKSLKDNVNKVLAYSIVGAFIAMVGATLLGYAKVESVLAGTLVGYLSAKCEQVLAYYFGSSKGSQAKTEMIHNSTPLKPCV